MTLARNEKHGKDMGTAGYKDLGWQNGWKYFLVEKDGRQVMGGYEDQPEYTACAEARHTIKSGDKREYDNSLFKNRGTDHVYIRDTCKILSHVDMSD